LNCADVLRDFALRGLRGLTAGELTAIGDQLHATRLAPQVRAAALAEIERRRAAGYLIAIATGTFDFVVAPFAQQVRADMVVATRVAFKNERCLGCVAGRETLGPAKADAVRAAVAIRGEIDWNASCVYSDSTMDATLLALVGEPILVTQLTTCPLEVPNHTKLVSWPDCAT
jgi:phosphoserine phosphatase